ncbi:MAG: hypothetical protein M3P39_12065, partial [Actinomycetota bacterium]|nr:hypothetical protein [Actinomycetota bacterium]
PPAGGDFESRPAPAGRPSRRFLRPFPVVRIAGSLRRDGARLSVLSVRAPRGARIVVRCGGRSCPTRVRRFRARALTRLRTFERDLRAGTRLSVRVTRGATIGKHVRFLIRRGQPPRRVDRCVLPGRAAPVACPAR